MEVGAQVGKALVLVTEQREPVDRDQAAVDADPLRVDAHHPVELGHEVRDLEEPAVEGQVVGHYGQARRADRGADRQRRRRRLGSRHRCGRRRRRRRSLPAAGARPMSRPRPRTRWSAFRGRDSAVVCAAGGGRSRPAPRRARSCGSPPASDPRAIGSVRSGWPNRRRRDRLAEDDEPVVVTVESALACSANAAICSCSATEASRAAISCRGRELLALRRHGEEVERRQQPQQGDPDHDHPVASLHRATPGSTFAALLASSVCSAAESRACCCSGVADGSTPRPMSW